MSHDLPASVYRYLTPDEVNVISLHQHPGVLIPPLATASGGLLAAITASVVSNGIGIPELVVWILAGLLILRFIWAAYNWSLQEMVITDRRFLLISGIMNRRVASTELPDLKKRTFERSFAGRILGYGTYRIGPDAPGQLVINYIPYPEQLDLELTSLAYKHEKNKSD